VEGVFGSKLVPVDADLFDTVSCCQSVTSQQVLPVSSHFQVLRIAALSVNTGLTASTEVWIVAHVVQNGTFRYRTNQPFIEILMRPVCYAVLSELTISITIV
jgi:hypothetical protein